MGGHHVKVYQAMEDVQLVAVVDPDLEKAKRKVSDKSVHLYSNLEEMLAHEQVDLVDICTPSYLHADQAIKAMNSGIHVLCEKPVALTLEDADRMLQASIRNGVFFMVAHVIRFWPEYLYLKEVFERGEYGKLNHLFLSRICRAPESSWKNWMIDKTLSGGAATDLHIHDTDFILYMLGDPLSVSSYGVEQGQDISYIMTNYEYRDYIVQAEGGWYRHSSPFKMSFRANFELAALEYAEDKLMLYQLNEDPQQIQLGKRKTAANQSPDTNIHSLGAYYDEIKYFMDCIRNNVPPQIIKPEDVINTLKWIDKEQESVHSGIRIYA